MKHHRNLLINSYDTKVFMLNLFVQVVMREHISLLSRYYAPSIGRWCGPLT